MRYAQLIMGPAGCGKSTYCAAVHNYCETIKRTVHVINLDPAAEVFNYPVSWDIRDVISVEDVAETLNLGPNGGLLYCMEFLMQNVEVLEEALGDFNDDYLIFDLPGQIELYTHVPVMRQFVSFLEDKGYRMTGVYLLDSQFIDDPAKFFSGTLSATAAMLHFALPHVNLLTKMDLVRDESQKRDIESYLSPDTNYLLQELDARTTAKQHKLNAALAQLIDDFSLVQFHPFDRSDEESVGDALRLIDHCLQYGEDEEPQEPAGLNDDADD